ncbi:hypothetical protein VAPA_2c07560 [Variovorax paradoxus B4]|uniref:Transmembrane protein n=2 Tax=Variovorax paradoxus TaxID=34073 RepID=T1XL41_VARPD|nr:hypothetical protein VAPA_2c07560 [Variovorax paradoxus B4]
MQDGAVMRTRIVQFLAVLGLLWVAALAANLVLAVVVRSQSGPIVWVALCLVTASALSWRRA